MSVAMRGGCAVLSVTDNPPERLSTRELSELCGSIRHQSTIAHLRSGQRDTCSVHLARRIEEILRQHAGALFTPVVCNDKVATTPPTPTRKRAT